MSDLYLYHVQFEDFSGTEGKRITEEIYASGDFDFNETEIKRVLKLEYEDEFYYEDITQILPVYEVWYTDGEDGEEYTKKIAARNHQRAEEIFYNEYVHEDTNIQSIEQVKKLT